MPHMTEADHLKMVLEVRGKANIKLGEYEEAIVDYKQMVERLPDDPIPNIGLAMALKSAGRHAEALAIFDRLMKQHDRPDILVGKVLVLIDAKRMEEARNELRIALARYPGYPTLRQLAQRMGL